MDQLAEWLGCSGGQAAPCLVYGPGATGKTAVVRWVAARWCSGVAAHMLPRLPCAPACYASCIGALCWPLTACLPACRALLEALHVRHAYVNCVE